jgi:hypothetical protein
MTDKYQKDLSLKEKVSNTLRTTMLQIGVCSYEIDKILDTLTSDIIHVLGQENEQQ